jgi:hypothetical protein
MKRARNVALAAAVLGFAIMAVGVFVDPTRALFAWLSAFAFAFTTAVGALFLVQVAHVSKAGWLVVIRRFPEAVSGTLPILAVLFVPLLLGARRLYPWAVPLEAMDDVTRHIVEEKRAYLNLPFFGVRAAAYFAVLVAVNELLRRWSLANDARPRIELTTRMRALSAASLPAMALVLTFAAFDWLMSLDPSWYSTMFGFYAFAGGAAGAVGLVAVLVARARTEPALARQITVEHTHALGRLLLALVIVWAYIAFSQFLVVWIADLPEEISFYATRVAGSWTPFTWVLVLGHFVVPFFVLLSRGLKRRPSALAIAGGWLVLMHLADVYWLVMPAHDASGTRLHWLDLGALLAVCGSQAAVGLTRFARAAPIPTSGPELARGLEYEAAR